ncbi:MMPL family transporter [Geomonas anaerohicana]|uniref:MMPL family transporter n=1 Tax=Geomonas anaerohicana TaxID=2798583 RepID=A0ABS0Y8V7_9BACT|nr:MMPL family transporter [Geomonas anaerohicana]MBJ6748730.1 MMPL family transporter [Geomonas anaerohicana]
MGDPSLNLFGRLYRYFAGRRRVLYGATLLLVALSLFASSRLRLQDDIVAMLPDDGSSAATDFRLLQLAPFTRKLVVSLKTQTPGDSAALVATADSLAQGLREAKVGKVSTGPAQLGPEFFGFLGSALPNLCGEADLKRLEAATAPEKVRDRLREGYEQLFAPEGWALKGKLQADPLSFSDLVLERLRFLNLVPNMRLVQNHFVSADGSSALITVDTTVPMTDSAASRQLMDRVDTAVKKTVPAGFSATVLSGHRYTLANADAVKRDLYLVLTLSVVAVFAIYLVFLRSMSALFVFLVPSSVLAIASGAMALWAPKVFAVTLGFGGVLLGMVDEYATMIYFACRKGGKDPALITAEVARPVLSGALATLLSFGVMLLSVLPGQRQLAVYSMTGIAAALLFSLVVLPHLVRPAPGGSLPFGGMKTLRPPRRVVLVVWCVLLAVCAFGATTVRFNGSLQAVNLVPAELKRAEVELNRTWGDLQGKALIFAEGKDLESALELNRRVFERLAPTLPPGELVSLAPLLPSEAQQRENRARWVSFWQDGRAARLERDLAREGAAFGFTGAAFAPFLATLKAPPAPLNVDGLRAAGLSELVDALVLENAGSVRVLTLVPDRPELVERLSRELGALPGVHVVSESRFGATMGGSIIRDFTRYLAITGVLVFLLVAAVFRAPSRIALVLVPVVTGVVCMLGIMGLLGLQFNIFNIAATILIIGLCVDYGIFMVSRLEDGGDETSSLAVLVSGLTTLAGLGALALARHPSMQSIGVSVLLGVGTGIPAALFVIPALRREDTP